MGADYWAELELRHLVSLQAIAQTGSFHGAADQLEYTQSAVSQHIATLEGIVGARLLERSRGRRTVSLTEAGALLVRHADAIVARLRAAQADMAAYAEGVAGVLRIGTYPSVGARILPVVVRRFAAAWPGVEIRLTESSNDEALLELVERGELDVAFAVFPLPDGPFEALELMRDPFVLAVNHSSPLASLSRLPSLQEIAGLPLIGFSQCRSTAAADAHLQQHGLRGHFVFRSDDNRTVQGLVGAGVGSALVPRLTVDETDPEIAVLPTDLPPRIISLAWHRDRYRSPAARAFIDLASVVCSHIEGGEVRAIA